MCPSFPDGGKKKWGYYNYVKGVQDCSRGNTYHNRKFRDAALAHGLIVDHHDKYGWTITTPSDALLEVILKYELSDILLNRNEFGGFQITGTEDATKQLRNKALQEAMLEIRYKYGKNSILRGISYTPASTARERNNQIGGHKSGNEDSKGTHAKIKTG